MVGFTYNEESRRYVDDEPKFFQPDVWRERAENKKQGSSNKEIAFLSWNFHEQQQSLRKGIVHESDLTTQSSQIHYSISAIIGHLSAKTTLGSELKSTDLREIYPLALSLISSGEIEKALLLMLASLRGDPALHDQLLLRAFNLSAWYYTILRRHWMS